MSFPIKSWIKKIFPFCRSITGEGLEKTLAFISEKVPDLKIIKFKTGLKVFDWKIPKVWNIKDAYIENEKGEKYAKLSKSNLHVVSYSSPINKYMSRDQLEKKIFTHPKIPEAIPYITSYYIVCNIYIYNKLQCICIYTLSFTSQRNIMREPHEVTKCCKIITVFVFIKFSINFI